MMFFKCCLILGSLPWKNRFKKKKKRENRVTCLRFPLSSQFWLTFFVLTTGALCPCRPAGGKSNDAGVLPGRSDIRRNSRSPFPLSNGRQRDGVHYSHHQTHERHDLDQISHGQAWVAEPVRHLRVHLAASNNPSIMIEKKKNIIYSSYVHQWTAGVLLMSVLLDKAKKKICLFTVSATC